MIEKAKMTYVRFNLSQRIEHMLLLISFGMLCLTGLPQKFAYTSWGQGIIRDLGGLESTRMLHHFFAGMLAAEFVYHLLVIAYELLFARRKPLGMLPGPQDVRDGLASVAHLAGLRPEGPRFGRYDFRQKIEYWAMIWGLVVMGLTGIILMFPTFVTGYVPGVLIPASKAIHGYEAILAFLAIITWHFYNAHLSADVFPLDTSIFTGRISAERMAREHPLEMEQMTRDA